MTEDGLLERFRKFIRVNFDVVAFTANMCMRSHYLSECVSDIGGEWSHLVPFHWKRVTSSMTREQAEAHIIMHRPCCGRRPRPDN